MLKIRVELEYDPEAKAWAAVCPELPVCVSCGDTREKALSKIREAIALHLEPTREKRPGAEEVFVRV